MLTTFLIDLAGRPFVWGQLDCVLALADWVLASGRNRDPAEGFRGTYSTEDDCVAVLQAQGGVLRVVARSADDLCLERVDPAAAPPGSIAVVRYGRKGQRTHHYGAIRTPSGRWAIKLNDGLMFVSDVGVAAAWRV